MDDQVLKYVKMYTNLVENMKKNNPRPFKDFIRFDDEDGIIDGIEYYCWLDNDKNIKIEENFEERERGYSIMGIDDYDEDVSYIFLISDEIETDMDFTRKVFRTLIDYDKSYQNLIEKFELDIQTLKTITVDPHGYILNQLS
jgi:hypothetical protein